MCHIIFESCLTLLKVIQAPTKFEIFKELNQIAIMKPNHHFRYIWAGSQRGRNEFKLGERGRSRGYEGTVLTGCKYPDLGDASSRPATVSFRHKTNFAWEVPEKHGVADIVLSTVGIPDDGTPKGTIKKRVFWIDLSSCPPNHWLLLCAGNKVLICRGYSC